MNEIAKFSFKNRYYINRYDPDLIDFTYEMDSKKEEENEKKKEKRKKNNSVSAYDDKEFLRLFPLDESDNLTSEINYAEKKEEEEEELDYDEEFKKLFPSNDSDSSSEPLYEDSDNDSEDLEDSKEEKIVAVEEEEEVEKFEPFYFHYCKWLYYVEKSMTDTKENVMDLKIPSSYKTNQKITENIEKEDDSDDMHLLFIILMKKDFMK